MSSEYKIEKWEGHSPPNAEDLRSKMESEGFYVYEWSDGAGATYGKHFHGNDQSHWIISGTLELNVEGFGIVRLEAGDRDFMPANTYHSAKVIGNKSVVYLIGEKR